MGSEAVVVHSTPVRRLFVPARSGRKATPTRACSEPVAVRGDGVSRLPNADCTHYNSGIGRSEAAYTAFASYGASRAKAR